jgi:ligand-binding sensor domain-containing protein/serine phosphatase RsbU (regulator of sigma subunit)
MIRLISFRRTCSLKVFLTLFSYFTTLPLFSQQYNFENFTLENGLPQATIFCIFQDSRGYLWLGTEGSGVCRFDGKYFQVINQSKGLAGDVVRSILEDRKGRLWFGTDAGVAVYDGNKFITINEKKGLSSNTVVCLFKDKNDTIWAGTAGDNGGLNKIELLHPDSVKITKYTVDNGLSDNNIFALCEDNYNRLWIGSFGGGITIRSKPEDVSPVSFTRLQNFPSNHILTMTTDSMNNLWVGTYDKGIFKMVLTEDLSLCKIEHISNTMKISDNTVWTILPTQNETWFGTNENGILRFMNQKIKTINIDNGLLKNQIISIFKDREENIWVSSGDGGISRFLGDRFYSLTKKEGLTDENVYSITISSRGDTWIGTYGGGLYRLIQGPDIFKNYTVNDGLPDNIINSIALDHQQDNLWIATPGGIARFNGKSFKVFNEKNDGLANNDVNCILIDKNNIVWCGTKKGISIYDGIGFKNTKEGYLPNSEVQSIIQDKSGNIWCGTLGGLAKFNADKLTTYDEAEGLKQKKIHCLAEDKSGNIWIGTFGGGIFRLSVNTNDTQPVKQIITDNSLNSPNVYSLIFENDTTLMAGTDKGLNRIMLDNNSEVKRVLNYSLKDGFRGIKNNLNAVVRKGDEIWFGTVNGITVYRPNDDKLNSSKPKIQITDIKLFFKEVDWSKEKYEIIPWTQLPKNPELSYKNNHLTFHFVGLLFSDKEEITYQYMLEGLDKYWSPPRKENEAVYPGLSPGDYTFKVVALDRYSNRSNETAAFSFIITPPFWQTKWFYIICTIIAFSSIAAFIKYRERKLRNERDRLERIVKERTVEVVRQKDQIENQRDEIQIQHNIVTEQKKDIMDSIQYAKRIQTAAIPSEENVVNELKDLFILYKPRDVVSGDFYWMGIENGQIIMIAADCTGHGVPGAFTSMLGISMLNDIIGKESTTSPDNILNELRNNIIRSLKQTPDGESKDGMDIAILTIDKKTNNLDFAGAMNSLVIIRDANQDIITDSYMEEGKFRLFELKGDKMPAAIHIKMEPFKKTTIKIKSDDKFYIFSDGFEDQFGGPEHRKFMKKNLKKMLLQIHHLPMEEQKQLLVKTIDDWKGDLAQVDDILVIGFSI